ncbi:MAG: hypothetical protein ABI690_30885 [Chloroflexota bacterium]
MILALINTAKAAYQDRQQPLTGWLDTHFGDPLPGSGAVGEYQAILSDGHGHLLSELDIDPNLAETYRGQQVTIVGQQIEAMNSAVASVPRLTVQTITPVSAISDVTVPGVTGSQPWVNLLCKFSDVATEPFPPSHYIPLFSDVYPGLDHYFRQMSYNNINLIGTFTASQWYVLPHPTTYYFENNTLHLDQLANDCALQANADVYFPGFRGINMMLNEALGCCAYGGTTTLTIDGQTRSYRATWIPSTAQRHDVVAHEMGHGFGFHHSTGPANNPPNGLNVYVSEWDVMSISLGTGLVMDTNPEYSYLPPGTIAYHLDQVGWIPMRRRVVVTPGRSAMVTLEQLQLPNQNDNALIVRIPISGMPNLFYTVEARTLNGYDQNIPAAAVVIHLVNTQASLQNGDALVVDADTTNTNVNDAGARWLPGETFTDIARNISIEVLSSTSTSFSVRVKNNVQPDSSNAAPDLLFSADGNYHLSWDPVSWATGYEIQIDTDKDFLLPYYLSDASLPANQWSFDLTAMQDGIYYWRVRTKDANGLSGSWSSIQSLTVLRPG